MAIIISVTGDLGSGKTTICNILAEKYNLKRLSTGDLHRRLAIEHNLSAVDMNLYMEKHLEIDDIIDNKLREQNELDEDIVIDSRMAWHFVPRSFKVFITVNPDIAAKRIFDDDKRKDRAEKYLSLAETKEKLLLRKESENRRYYEKYGVNVKDLSNYSFIINTDYISAEEAAQRIIDAYHKNHTKVQTSTGLE